MRKKFSNTNLGQMHTRNRFQSHLLLHRYIYYAIFYLLGPSDSRNSRILVFGPFRVTDISNLSLFSMIIWAIWNYSRYLINPSINFVPSPPFNFIMLLTTGNIFLKISFNLVHGALDEPAPTRNLLAVRTLVITIESF